MIRIVHFSDWHGHAQQLPEADLYVCTGDMLSNFPVKDRDPGSYTFRDYKIDPQVEVERQTKQVKQFVANGGFAKRMASPFAPVVCVRGNHDFIPLAGMFEGCNIIHEFVDNELIELVCRDRTLLADIKLRITGHRGIPYIHGTWNDETMKPDLRDRVDRMPEADIFVTHYPPAGMLDGAMPPGLSMGGGWVESFGLEGMVQALIRKVSSDYELTDSGLTDATPARAAHCFGHIHECGGYKTQAVDVMFSNAATTINVFEIDPVKP